MTTKKDNFNPNAPGIIALHEAVKDLGLSVKDSDRCKNFFAMGLVYWLYGRDLGPTERWADDKFGKKMPHVADANKRALRAGRNYGETTDAFVSSFQVDRAKLEPGQYRNMTGNQAIAWGCVAMNS